MAAIALTAAAGMLAERRGAARTTIALSIGFAAIVSFSCRAGDCLEESGLRSRQRRPPPRSSGITTPTPRRSRSGTVRCAACRRATCSRISRWLKRARILPRASRRSRCFVCPAGVYRVEGEGGVPGPRPVTVTVDGELGPQWKWSVGALDASPAGWRREFSLPVPVRSAGRHGSHRSSARPSRQHRRIDATGDRRFSEARRPIRACRRVSRGRRRIHGARRHVGRRRTVSRFRHRGR